MAETSAEKTEDATPKRRREARRKGTVAKSTDLTSALVVLGLLIVLPSAISQLGTGFVHGTSAGLSNIPLSSDFRDIGARAWLSLQPAVGGLILIVATAMVIGVASNFGQVGFVLSGEALMPSFAKLNPLNGLKRLFSRQAIFDGGKATIKSGLFMLLTWSVISSSWNKLFGLAYLPPLAALVTVGELIRSIAMKIALTWLFLAAIDYAFQRKQVNKQLKMTKEEVKQEMKDAETSMELKMAMAKRRRQLSKKRLAEAMKSANVVITNPTHFAIAISYQQGKDYAPIVVAKGQDFLAARIRELAAENKVPLVANPPLARTLYKQCEVGDFVPRELFQGVAEVLAYVYRTMKKVRTQA
jgi:flagellar biosynthetic protein FlhB